MNYYLNGLKRYSKLFLTAIFLCFTLISCGEPSAITTAKTIEVGRKVTLEDAVNAFYQLKGEKKIKWEYVKDDDVIHTIGSSTGIILSIPTEVSGDVVSIYTKSITSNGNNDFSLLNYDVYEKIYKDRFYANWKYKSKSGFVWTPKEFEDSGWDSLLIFGRFPTPKKGLYTRAVLNKIGDKFDFDDADNYLKDVEYYLNGNVYSQEIRYTLPQTDGRYCHVLLKSTVNLDTQECTLGGGYTRGYTQNGFRDMNKEILQVADKYDEINMRGKYKE